MPTPFDPPATSLRAPLPDHPGGTSRSPWEDTPAHSGRPPLPTPFDAHDGGWNSPCCLRRDTAVLPPSRR